MRDLDQTFGAVAHAHPHLHVLMTEGAFRCDVTSVPLPAPVTIEPPPLRLAGTPT